ncbi:hypothetical protein ACQ4LE_007007 [Meloidogyne hapla]
MISEIESTSSIRSSPQSFSPHPSNITLTSELFNMFNTNINIPETTINNIPTQMSVQTANALLLLHLVQMQQIFKQSAENTAIISQAIIAEKNAMAKELVKIRQQKQQKEIKMKRNNKGIIKTEQLFEGISSVNNDINKNDFFTRCGITWTYLTSTRSISEFDDLRRRHQVSKNRHVGYGIRYACTRNAKARDNCPYLLLHISGNNGIQHVYSRNCHTHPIRHIRSRNRN